MITQSRQSAPWEFVIYTLLTACVLYTCTMVAFTLADRVNELAALHCARASDGTDQAIAECYEARGLPTPEDL